MKRGLVKQVAFNDDYLERLADERAAADWAFLLKVLARKGAQRRRRSTRVAGSLLASEREAR